MAALIVDTHAAVWYLSDSVRLSSVALEALERTSASGDPIFLASISLVEIIYLVEKERLPEAALERLEAALADPGTPFDIVPLHADIARLLRQIPRDQVPDMPDRIIAGTALWLGVPLVTRDRKIQASALSSIW